MKLPLDRLASIVGAPDDSLVGRIAVERGWIAEAQLGELRRRQAESGNPFLGVLLLQEGRITPAQLAEILQEQEKRLMQLAGNTAPRVPGSRRGLFQGMILAAAGVVSPSRLEAALAEQWRLQRAGTPRRLARILIEEGYAAAGDLLRHMHCAECGRKIEGGEADSDPICPDCASGAQLPPADDERRWQGVPFGRYRLIERLGEGATGVVWKAWDPRLNRWVAVKIFSGADARGAERFLRSARSVAALHHPNIPPIHDVGECEGQCFWTADLLEGEPLDSWARQARPVRERVAIVLSIARALAHAHARGVLHRDVKPANILVDGADKPWLLDFEHAPLARDEKTFGTAPYLSPEVVEGREEEIGPASDQFSLGVVLYELLTGRRPFRGESLSRLLDAIVREEPTRPSRLVPGLAADLDRICSRAMAKRAAERYPSLDAMADDLERFLTGRPLADPFRRRGRFLRPLLAASALGIAALVLFRPFPKDPLERAFELERAGRLQEAEAAYREQLDRRPEEAESGLARVRRAIADQESSRREAERRTRLQQRATRLFEEARAPLDEASRYLSRTDASYEELVARIDAGRKLIEEGVEAAPWLPQGYFLLGRAWELQGEEERAETCWRKALELDPRLAAAHLALGRLYLFQSLTALVGTPSEAAAARKEATRLAGEAAKHLEAAETGGFETALQRDVATAMLALARGDTGAVRRLASEGARVHAGEEGEEEFHLLAGLASRGPEALVALDRALALRPKDPIALFFRARVFQEAGRRHDSLRDYSEAVRIHPRFAAGWINRGIVLDELGRFQEAIADYTRALELPRHRKAAYFNRGRAKQSSGDLDGALEDYGSALALDPGLAPALNNRAAILVDRGKLEEAMRDLDAAVRADPRHVEARHNRALVLRRENPEAARRELDEALAIDPRFVPARIARADLRFQQGDARGAIEDLNRALEIDPNQPRALALRASARLNEGDLAPALADAEAALRLDPRFFDALVLRGDLFLNLGEPEKAFRDYEEALRICPPDRPLREALERSRRVARRTLCRVHGERALMAGEHAAARPWLEEAVSGPDLSPQEEGRLRLALARVYAVLSADRESATADKAKWRDRAFEQLEKLAAAGLLERSRLQEKDLDPLRDDPRWGSFQD